MSKFEQHLTDKAILVRLVDQELDDWKVRFCSNRAYLIFYTGDEPHSYFLTLEQARLFALDFIHEAFCSIALAGKCSIPEQAFCTQVLGQDFRGLQVNVVRLKAHISRLKCTNPFLDRFIIV